MDKEDDDVEAKADADINDSWDAFLDCSLED